MRAITDTKGDGVGCVLIVLKGQLLCIRTDPIDVTVFLEIQAQSERTALMVVIG